MDHKFYQFHYAVTKDFEVENIGILTYYSMKAATKDDLITYTREYLKDPNANIVISHITKLRKPEYEKLTGKKVM